MGREINRVPLDFDWPIGETWLGYAVHVKFPDCPTCRIDDRRCGACLNTYRHSDGYSQTARDIKTGLRSGSIPWPVGVDRWNEYKAMHLIADIRGLTDDDLTCPVCKGHGDLATPELREWSETMPETPIPSGDGWQLWETVGDSPMSPVFATDTELIDWMTVNPWMLGRVGLVPSDRDTATKFVAIGWAPSMITTNDSSGVTVVDGVTAVVSMHEVSP